MLEIKQLYKEHNKSILHNISLTIPIGKTASIECSKETSDTLIRLILDKEKPTYGKIDLDQQPNSQYLKNGLNHIGIVLEHEGLYERLSVINYLKLFNQIVNSQYNIHDIMMKLALLDIGDVKISKLSYSQKKRLNLARERLKDLKLLIFQEPILNLDKESATIILRNLDELRDMGVTILNTSVSYKDTILLGGQTYILDELGLREVDQDLDPSFNKEMKSEQNEEKSLYKIEKIPTRVNDRILLFNPIEIDFIESVDSISHINVRGEKFISTLSLNDLETRLKYLGFYRCHRSYLVNLQRVREIITWTRNSYSLILDDKNKSSIPLSKGRMDELKDILKL